MITRLLVANRAEIASRVFRTCRDLGIETVAVHSDADALLPYVAEADHAVHLPGNAPADTYLRADLVLDAARRSGADAIHPGYGFLSENADFARAVIDAGLTWVGPPPEAIVSLGSKIESKKLMEAAGVPVLTNHTVETATEADLPLLVKASAGGGGRGMRIVRTLADLPGEIEKARAEAESAFGDGTVFVEPYVEQGRHVEVQLVGTTVFGDRDCSVQRRHQKVVEEAPAPGLSDEVRTALHDAARNAAEAIDYRGAGTVEFLYDADTERFFFLEMNTRLQVEHPVTEAVHGVDLVALQIEAAEHDWTMGWVDPPNGHAIEVRLYAEDPAADYQPQSGLLTTFEIPTPDGVRVDTGFTSGSVVSTHYDAMLAKVIAHAPTREAAARKLAGVLSRARIHGLVTNRDLLVEILRDRLFLEGYVSTAFLSGDGVSRLASLAPQPPSGLASLAPQPPSGLASLAPQPPSGRASLAPQPPSGPASLAPQPPSGPASLAPQPSSGDTGAPVAAALALAERARLARTVQQRLPVAWRNVPSQPQVTEFEGDPDPVRVAWWGGRDGYTVEDYTVLAASPTSVTLEADGVRTSYDVVVSATTSYDVVDVDHPGGHQRLVAVPRFVDPADAVASGSLLAPMPGTVVKVAVEAGQEVAAGDVVLVLEAMKMQHTVTAPTAGTVTEINVRPGAQVAAGEVLAVVDAPASAEGEPA